MITIKTSATADSRTCDSSVVSIQQLYRSSVQHIEDVDKGIDFFINMMADASEKHDSDKLTDIHGFYRDFIVNFKTTDWWDNHRKVTRHHILVDDGVPEDVNLVDVIEMITDCVMAGMGRCGSIYPLDIKPEVLMKAFNNTVELLKENVTVEKE